ncbi:2'-5' RNA ligase family protein [uncultured Phycicoccus sp.]|uniref:2'-5' RNA ligase family protein n=1 Tax=uncultured Phycicoccus sp. TaxID=661422 RepID=UPI00263887A4|nr:2'-5' RNA ligase family protein [uncultured Phycicoccus sp.]
MHHVELLLDPDTDAAVRDQWRLLDEAGLPSQAQHRSTSNRPHVTLAMTKDWPVVGARQDVLAPLAVLPLPVRLGAPVVFGRDPYVLARLVVATGALLALHRDLVHRLPPLASDLLVPDRWTPHVTLGRRLAGGQVAEALALLAQAPEREAALDRARHWDSDARLDEPLDG